MQTLLRNFLSLKTAIAAANSLWLGYGLVSFCQFAGECEYFVQCRIELRSDSLHGFQRRITAAAFDAADIGAVESRAQREFFLAELATLAQQSEGRANVRGDVHPSTIAFCGLLIYGL